ncbi:MAG: hypothetical protein Q8941_03590 [Bacteroidota bacterium]|nr:hypothetical protein [Bacteroidota bacterium]
MIKSTLSFLSLAAILLFVACNKSNNISPDVATVASSGTWQVSLFINSGQDETAGFSGYSFTFNSNGALITLKNGVSKNGTWNVNGSNQFNIDLGPKDNTNLPFGGLTHDWKILSVANTEIRLGDDNISSNEFLTFSKN